MKQQVKFDISTIRNGKEVLFQQTAKKDKPVLFGSNKKTSNFYIKQLKVSDNISIHYVSASKVRIDVDVDNLEVKVNGNNLMNKDSFEIDSTKPFNLVIDKWNFVVKPREKSKNKRPKNIVNKAASAATPETLLSPPAELTQETVENNQSEKEVLKNKNESEDGELKANKEAEEIIKVPQEETDKSNKNEENNKKAITEEKDLVDSEDKENDKNDSGDEKDKENEIDKKKKINESDDEKEYQDKKEDQVVVESDEEEDQKNKKNKNKNKNNDSDDSDDEDSQDKKNKIKKNDSDEEEDVKDKKKNKNDSDEEDVKDKKKNKNDSDDEEAKQDKKNKSKKNDSDEEEDKKDKKKNKNKNKDSDDEESKEDQKDQSESDSESDKENTNTNAAPKRKPRRKRDPKKPDIGDKNRKDNKSWELPENEIKLRDDGFKEVYAKPPKGGIRHQIPHHFEPTKSLRTRVNKVNRLNYDSKKPSKKRSRPDDSTESESESDSFDYDAPPERTEKELEDMTTKERLVEALSIIKEATDLLTIKRYMGKHYHSISTKELKSLLTTLTDREKVVQLKKGRVIHYRLSKRKAIN